MCTTKWLRNASCMATSRNDCFMLGLHGSGFSFSSRQTVVFLLLLHHSISLEICTRFCFAVLCCGYTLTDFPISIRLTSLALWQSNDCPSASKATLMNMDKYFMWIHYELLHNHNKAKHNKTVCIFLGIYCTLAMEAFRSCYMQFRGVFRINGLSLSL